MKDKCCKEQGMRTMEFTASHPLWRDWCVANAIPLVCSELAFALASYMPSLPGKCSFPFFCIFFQFLWMKYVRWRSWTVDLFPVEEALALIITSPSPSPIEYSKSGIKWTWNILLKLVPWGGFSSAPLAPLLVPTLPQFAQILSPTVCSENSISS